jgi:hypothetical protein
MDIYIHKYIHIYKYTYISIYINTCIGYVVANVSTIMGNFDQLGEKSKNRLTAVSEYMADKACSHHVQKDVIDHFRKSSVSSSFNEGMCICIYIK